MMSLTPEVKIIPRKRKAPHISSTSIGILHIGVPYGELLLRLEPLKLKELDFEWQRMADFKKYSKGDDVAV